MLRSALAIAAVALVAASVSGNEEQASEAIPTAIPMLQGEPAAGDPFSLQRLGSARPLGPDAPPWARWLHQRSLRVLFALTDPGTGAMIAGARDRWDFVWPRDAAAGAIALSRAGLLSEARRIAGFLQDLDIGGAARFHPDGEPVPGRPAAGDAEGWVSAAELSSQRTGHSRARTRVGLESAWRDRQDYGENVTGDLLGNAIAAGAPAAEIAERFHTGRGLVREAGGEDLDSAAAWAVTLFPRPGLRQAARRTLLELTADSTPYGIPPIEGWTPGEVWTAPTAWSAWALAELGETAAADRLLAGLRRSLTADGTLPERVSVADGRPTSTTPLAWSHAFAILALRARYP